MPPGCQKGVQYIPRTRRTPPIHSVNLLKNHSSALLCCHNKPYAFELTICVKSASVTRIWFVCDFLEMNVYIRNDSLCSDIKGYK